MGVYIICHSCNNKVYLEVRAKSELPYFFTLRCPFCLKENIYNLNEVNEEKWEYTCTVCNGKFFIRNPPPRRVRCPYCSSLIYIDRTDRLIILEKGQAPLLTPASRSIVGALGGVLLGGLIAGPIGAFLGLLAGGALGASAEYLEAKEE
jgi:DNA-directed RNA polymerase subunit RPC12/RpoP